MMNQFLLYVASVAVGSLLLLETYVQIPINILQRRQVKALPDFPHRSAVILFPGYGGPDANTDRIIAEIEESDRDHKEKRFTHCYDWSDYRGNIIRTAYISKEIGKSIGRQLSLIQDTIGEQKSCRIKNLHVIGISVGSFAANECANEFRRGMLKQYGRSYVDSSNITITLSLLDPFISLGLIRQGYGAKHFGRFIDHSEQYLNTDDPVPFTNTPLPHCHTFDITSSQQRNSFQPLPGDSMHSWPAAYFGLNWRTKLDPRLKLNSHNSLFNRKGHITYVP